MFKNSQKNFQKLLKNQRSLLIGKFFENSALHSKTSGTNPNSEAKINITLTTIPERIHNIHITIESLFQQSVQANRIVLWLPKDRFKPNNIPETLKRQEARGLEIAFCEEDIGPYTKFYYFLKDNPSSYFITADDDIIYPIDFVDMLYRAYTNKPGIIYCHRAHRIELDKNRKILPYKKWLWDIKDSTPDLRVFPTGVGGVLYFPGCFDDEILNKEAFLKMSNKADDVWLKAMSLKKNTLCQHVEDSRTWSDRFIQASNTQMVKLKSHNKSPGEGNDKKIQAVFNAYSLSHLLS